MGHPTGVHAHFAEGIGLCIRELVGASAGTLVEHQQWSCQPLEDHSALPPGRYRLTVALSGRDPGPVDYSFDFVAEAGHRYELVVGDAA
jgi:hypothetical protein